MDTPKPDLKRIRYKRVRRPSPTWSLSLEGRTLVEVEVESSPMATAESSETPDAPAGSESPSDPPATSP